MPVVLLTSKLIAATSCPVGQGKLDLFDTECKGLQLEIRASGGRTWYLRYADRRGRQRQLKLADFRDFDLKQARIKATRLRREIAMGSSPAEEKDIVRAVPTLARFMEETYLPFAMAYKRSWKNDTSYLKHHLYPKFGSKFLDEITQSEIINFHKTMRDSGYAPATANRCLNLISNIFNRAIAWNTPGITANPAKGIPMFEENNELQRFLSDDEINRLYASVLRSRNEQLRYIIPMLILSGARKREVLDAQWADIDISRRIWRVPISKSGRARHVPISDGLTELLDRIPRTDSNPFIVPDPKTGRPFTSVQYFWHLARSDAGLPNVRIHDLRHSFASLLINSGRSLYEVQKILGHSQIRTTQRYAHLSDATLHEASNAAAQSLRDALRLGK